MFKITKAKRMIVSTVFVATSFTLYKIFGYTFPVVLLMLASTIWAGTPIFKKAFSSLRYKIVGIDALVVIAVVGATLIGEFWEAAAVTYLFMLGDFLEAKTIEKTRASIKKLLDLAPKIATVIRNGKEVQINPHQVVKGDVVVVKPGEKIAVDGIVTSGSAFVNQATITGEPIPVQKKQGDEVFSGTVIESGYLLIEAVSIGQDTTFARILNMVEEAQDKKAKVQKFIEKFSKYYTPAIIVLATLIFIIKQDIYLALTLLVIACPGALVISTPVSIVAGIGNGAKNGVLFKGGEVIERLSKAKVVAFDKTGTLTLGKPQVTKIKAFSLNQNQILRIAAIGEAFSEHPLAQAIIAKAKQKKLNISQNATNTQILTGKGISVDFDGQSYLIGNRTLFNTSQPNFKQIELYAQNQEELGQTVVFVGTQNKVLGTISIADTVRAQSKKLVKTLKKQGIKVVMLTGDNQRTAQAIANKLEITEFYGSLLPQDKVQMIKNLQSKYGQVVMVGDGVNDAPALATANLGIAVGGAGKDVAMETADIVLLGERLDKIAYAITLSKTTKNNMRQNLIFALAVVGVLLTGVLFKTVNLSVGMLVHELSVLLVILNALRLLSFKKNAKLKQKKQV